MSTTETLTGIYDRIRKIRRPRRPARLLAAAAVVFAVSSCGSYAQPETGKPLTEWKWSEVRGVMTACLDNGDRLYGYQPGSSIAVVPGGCRT